MTKKYIVAGNWKMNGSKEMATELLTEIKEGVGEIPDVEWIVFPPYPFLGQVEELLSGSPIAWGAQNLSDKPSGAHTGEVSAGMLQNFGCSYVLVGHSERRQFYGDSSEIVAAKFIAAAKAGLKPILCVGETLEERNNNATMQVVTAQLQAVLNLDEGIACFNEAIVAYEPVWAIGTGVTATPEQAQEVHESIRKFVGEYNKGVAESLRILYGGSVKPNNASELFAMSDIDGGLIGGASLKAQDFLEIGRSCN